MQVFTGGILATFIALYLVACHIWYLCFCPQIGPPFVTERITLTFSLEECKQALFTIALKFAGKETRWSMQNSTFVIKYNNGQKKFIHHLTGWWIDATMDTSWVSMCSPVSFWQAFSYIVVTKEFTMICISEFASLFWAQDTPWE